MLVAVFTLLLVTAGGLVTSNDAALSVPDWPLAWGRLIPPLEGGIRYEFAHRMLAATVAVLVGVQAFRLRRGLAWAAYATVLAQAALGGALVKLVDPKVLAIAHACLGQLCFGLTVAVAVELAGGALGHFGLPWIAVAALFGQTLLGAAVRHEAIGLVSHIAGAVVATGLVMWASMDVVIRYMEDAQRRRPAMALMFATGAQIFLGLAAYTARSATAGDPQPMAATVWATVAHVAMGAVALGAGVWLAMEEGRGK